MYPFRLTPDYLKIFPCRARFVLKAWYDGTIDVEKMLNHLELSFHKCCLGIFYPIHPSLRCVRGMLGVYVTRKSVVTSYNAPLVYNTSSWNNDRDRSWRGDSCPCSMMVCSNYPTAERLILGSPGAMRRSNSNDTVPRR